MISEIASLTFLLPIGLGAYRGAHGTARENAEKDALLVAASAIVAIILTVAGNHFMHDPEMIMSHPSLEQGDLLLMTILLTVLYGGMYGAGYGIGNAFKK